MENENTNYLVLAKMLDLNARLEKMAEQLNESLKKIKDEKGRLEKNA